MVAIFRVPESGTVVKPRFILGDTGELVLIPNPIQTRSEAEAYIENPRAIIALGKYDYWYDPLVYENSLYDYSATVRVAIKLWSRVKRRYFEPDRPLIGPPGRGVFNESSSAFRILTKLISRFIEHAETSGALPLIAVLPDGYSVERTQRGRPGIGTPVLQFCERSGLSCLDLADAFRAAGADVSIDQYFIWGFHYSERGNRIVASYLGAEIRKRLSRAPLRGSGSR